MRSIVTALLATAATASFTDKLTNHVIETLAGHATNSKNHKKVNEAPKVGSIIGWDTTDTITDSIGYAVAVNLDAGMSYESPLYNENEYLVNRLQLALYAGGRNYAKIWLEDIQFIVYFDVWGLKFAFFDNYVRYNVVEYGDFCNAAQWFLEVARMQLFFEVDANECYYGILDNEDDYCQWATYYIDHPFWEMDFFEDFWRGDLMDNDCGNEWYEGELVSGEQEDVDF
eukprot:CAMPEP_0176380762 /NCGR_PEP_ID=MMETSP0126-20121128/31367_1 /TAXON_ID=141414 ORGANISM="Strombidinopsis acuminatum, Strain SPMC142" /NCGR_SAMPLE_ID=MMETSP0126 /ASSEMBLY_ACC=CAM_ASM_000229 /LENGTH=227 /DNA_ID=CAMNT_0017744233 /DNA_START=32 /DNA_END=715 /DNA_ORIENTATION=+